MGAGVSESQRLIWGWWVRIRSLRALTREEIAGLDALIIAIENVKMKLGDRGGTCRWVKSRVLHTTRNRVNQFGQFLRFCMLVNLDR